MRNNNNDKKKQNKKNNNNKNNNNQNNKNSNLSPLADLSVADLWLWPADVMDLLLTLPSFSSLRPNDFNNNYNSNKI